MDRKLATIRKIKNIEPIPLVDNIEFATVDGWKVVIRKGSFSLDEFVVFCEIDSWIPYSVAPWICKRNPPEVYNGIPGIRLKTIKLRGQISQGLILKLESLNRSSNEVTTKTEVTDTTVTTLVTSITKYHLYEDVTNELKIQKYEDVELFKANSNVAHDNTFMSVILAPFPSFIPKSKQQRVQNLEEYRTDVTWEITEKLDGTSITVFTMEGRFGICSRNYEFKDIDSIDKNSSNICNRVTIVLSLNHLKQQMLDFKRNLAIQGELVGKNINSNRYKIKGYEFYVFDIYDIDIGQFLRPEERLELMKCFENLKHCPIIDNNYRFLDDVSVESLLKMAEGKSLLLEEQEREGIVFKCVQKDYSFKCVNNVYLLAYN